MGEEIKRMLGARIKSSIKKSGKTQKDIAKLLGISENALVNYIKGKRIPDAILITKIAQMCDVDIGWLLTGQGSMFLEQSSASAVNDHAAEYRAKEQEIARLRQEIARLQSELKKIDQDEEKDTALLQALQVKIRELELENRELVGQIKILKELLLKRT